VSGLAFSADDHFLVSTGKDQAVLVWETDFGADNGQADGEDDDAPDLEQDEEELEYFSFEVDLVDKSKQAKQQFKENKRNEAKKLREAMLSENAGDIEEKGEQDFYWNFRHGEKTSAQKIWKGYFKAPPGYTKPPKNQQKAPHIKATIDWVHGYRGSKCRNNIRYLSDDTICYHVAGLAVVYDPEKRTQRHFDKHTDDISAIAFAQDKKTVATGELGKSPKIFVWDSHTLQVK